MTNVKKNNKKKDKKPGGVESAEPAQKVQSPADILTVGDGEKTIAEASTDAAPVVTDKSENDPSRKR